MRVAVAVDGTDVAWHLGHCEGYLIADVADGQVVEPRRVERPNTQTCGTPALLRAHGVECVVAGGVGYKAAQRCADAGIGVVTGVEGDAIEALARLAAGTITPGDNRCAQGGTACAELGEERCPGHNERHTCTEHGEETKT